MYHAQFNKRVWGGDKSTASEIRNQYNAGRTSLLKYASVLYSFRADPSYASELLALRFPLAVCAQEFTSAESQDPQRFADSADILSTLLLWLSERPGVPPMDRFNYRKKAEAVCDRGLEVACALRHGPGAHSYFLLELTAIQILIIHGKDQEAYRRLSEIGDAAGRCVKDPNQRSRVFRKLGMLLRQIDIDASWLKGFRWTLASIFVPRASLFTRAKSIVALFRAHC